MTANTPRAAIALAFVALGGCTMVPASPATVAMVEAMQPRIPRAGEMMTYAALGEVPGQIEVIAEIEVPNNGEERAAIDARLREAARGQGANAIVLHPFNRWALGMAYNDGGWDGFDPRRVSRATALIVRPAP